MTGNSENCRSQVESIPKSFCLDRIPTSNTRSRSTKILLTPSEIALKVIKTLKS